MGIDAKTIKGFCSRCKTPSPEDLPSRNLLHGRAREALIGNELIQVQGFVTLIIS
jgi:hypothetical protein